MFEAHDESLELLKHDLEAKALYHDEASRYYKNIDWLISFPLKLCPFLASSTGFVVAGGVMQSDCAPWSPAKLVTAVLTFITGLFALLQDFFAYQKRSLDHREASMQFAELQRDIPVLCLQNVQAKYVLQTVEDKARVIENGAPEISRSFKQKIDQMMATDSRAKMEELARMRKQRFARFRPGNDPGICDELKTLPTTRLRSLAKQVAADGADAAPAETETTIERLTRDELLDVLALDPHSLRPNNVAC